MDNDVSIPIAKEYLKHGTFKNKVNEKFYSPKNNLGRKSHADLLKRSHKVWNTDLREVSKRLMMVLILKPYVFVRMYLQKQLVYSNHVWQKKVSTSLSGLKEFFHLTFQRLT